MLFTNPKGGINFAKDPAVVKYKGEYYLYHTIPPMQDGSSKFGIGIAKSSDMENWYIVGEVEQTQECEKNGLCAPSAIILNGLVHLFYQSYGNGRKDAICHAYSSDGIHFEKNYDNPIYRPSADWCCGRAIDADVCVFRDELYMYFATRDHEMNIQKIGVAKAPIDTDFSKVAWQQAIRQSVMHPELLWEGACIEAPATIVNNNKVFMFYGGSYNCSPQQIGCAISQDGIHFERLFYEPFLKNGNPGEWNASESGHPFIFRDDDEKCYLFYQGSPDNGKTWYISKKQIEFIDNIPVFIE